MEYSITSIFLIRQLDYGYFILDAGDFFLSKPLLVACSFKIVRLLQVHNQLGWRIFPINFNRF